MKSLIIILTLIQVVGFQVEACSGLNEPEIKALIDDSNSLEKFLTDAKFPKMVQVSKEDQKSMSAARMIPLSQNDENYSSDYQTTGRVEISSPNGDEIGYGTGFKISGSCVMVSAHVLYNQFHPQVEQNGKKVYKNKVKFVRGLGGKKQVQDAEIFFQMTEQGTDFNYDENGKPKFYGDNDLIILRLKNPNKANGYHSDPYYKNLKVLSPAQVVKGMNTDLGKQIRCVGLPYYKTSKEYGSCKGSDFLWHQDNARVFEQNLSQGKLGMASNVAAGPGMSGGHCALKDSKSADNSVFAVVANGFMGNLNSPTMPDVNFEGDYAGGSARYLSLLNVLDRRMTKELGFGLDKIKEKCK